MLSEESRGFLGLCLCEGVYAWGAKSDTCWVSCLSLSISKPEVLAEPKGTKKYIWHFPSSHLLPLPSQILLLLHRHVRVYKCSHTVREESLTWGVYKPSTFITYSSMASFCAMSKCLGFFSLETLSQVTFAANVLPVFLHPSPLNYCINASTNCLFLLLVIIASSNKQFELRRLHLFLCNYAIVGCLRVTEINPCAKSAAGQRTVWPGQWK